MHIILFELNERLGVYPLIGFNFTHERENITDLINGNEEADNLNAVGLNIGGGFHIPFHKFIPFLEYEYVVGDLSEHVITIGAFFHIGQKEEH